MTQYGRKALEAIEWVDKEIHGIIITMVETGRKQKKRDYGAVGEYFTTLLMMAERLIVANSPRYIEDNGLQETCRHILEGKKKEEMPYKIMYSFYDEALAYITANPIGYGDIETKVQVYYILLIRAYLEKIIPEYGNSVMDTSRVAVLSDELEDMREMMKDAIPAKDMPDVCGIESKILEIAFAVSGNGGNHVRTAVINLLHALVHEDAGTGKYVYELLMEEEWV